MEGGEVFVFMATRRQVWYVLFDGSFIIQFIHVFIHSLIHSFVHPPIHSIHSLLCEFIHLLICEFIYLLRHCKTFGHCTLDKTIQSSVED